MSAFVVEKSHINAMLKGAFQVARKYGEDKFTYYHNHQSRDLTSSNADEVGQVLLDECIKGVSYRYEDSPLTGLPGRTDAEYLIPFQFYALGKQPKPIEIIKITQCYEYQSCEHTEWETSEARSFCKALIEHTISEIPGYDEAPWEWHEDIPVNKPMRII